MYFIKFKTIIYTKVFLINLINSLGVFWGDIVPIESLEALSIVW
jgi:hypothetical protein